jgi:hypothetical protein
MTLMEGGQKQDTLSPTFRRGSLAAKRCRFSFNTSNRRASESGPIQAACGVITTFSMSQSGWSAGATL